MNIIVIIILIIITISLFMLIIRVFTYLKYHTKNVSSTESARVQRNLCPIAGGWCILLSGWWILFLTCPMGRWYVLGHSIHRRTVINFDHQKTFLGLWKRLLGLQMLAAAYPNGELWNWLSLHPVNACFFYFLPVPSPSQCCLSQ